MIESIIDLLNLTKTTQFYQELGIKINAVTFDNRTRCSESANYFFENELRGSQRRKIFNSFRDTKLREIVDGNYNVQVSIRGSLEWTGNIDAD